jgi:hypothetical protein
MNSKIQISDYELENDENMLHHYMHVCNPSKECDHEHHKHDHDSHDDHHHSHHHDHNHDSNDNHDDNEHHYCCGHHEHHENHDDYDDNSSHTHASEHNCFGIHMHGKHHHQNHPHMPMCGMMQSNVPYGMPLMIELEDDEDDDKDDDKVSKMLERIEKHNPEVLKLMSMYGIPYPAAKKLLKRIIRVTLHNK